MKLFSRWLALGGVWVGVVAWTPMAAADDALAKFGRLTRGDMAPEFKAVGVEGKDVNLADFRGRAVIVAFCNGSGPRDALLKLHDDFREQGLVLLAIFSGTTRESFEKWVAKNLPLDGVTAAWDAAPRTAPESIAGGRFGLGVIPATGVIDKEGKLVGGFVGFGSQSAAFTSSLLGAAGLKAPAEAPPPPGAPDAGPETLAVGAVAPDFATTDAQGRPVKLSDYAGKIVVLDFWATWCGPCLASLPHTEKVAAEAKAQAVVVLAACTDDTRAEFDGWLKKNLALYPTLIFSHDAAEHGDERAAKKLYGVQGIPTQFVIGRDGKIAAVIVGYGEGDPQLEEALAALGVKF